MDYVEELSGAGVRSGQLQAICIGSGGFVRRKLPLFEELRRLSTFRSNYAEDTRHHHHRHGDVFVRRLGARSLYLCHPRLAEHVFRTNVLNYPKGRDYDMLRPLIGEGIIVSDGEVWARQRRLLAPEFRLNQVGRYLPTINAEIDLLSDQWRAAAAAGASVNVGQDMQNFALRVLGGAIFRSDFSREAEVIGETLEICLVQGTKQMLSMGLLPPWLPTPGNLRARAAEQRLNHSVRGLIAEGRALSRGGCPFSGGAARAPGPGEAATQAAAKPAGQAAGAADLLTRMLDAKDPDTGAGMSEQQLLDEIKSLILAGHETSALVLSWALYLLARHPRIEARVLEESRRVLGDQPARLEDVDSLVFTRQVLLETMRLYPPVPGVTRQALADDSVEGVEIRAGESVTIPLYLLHRHPEFWADPDRFDPDRFAPDRVDAIDPYSYLPFLRRRRACLGEHFAMLELVVALASIVSRFSLARVDEGEIGIRPISTLRMARPLVMRPRERVPAT
ncbi:cytochrome P450 [Enhygromyxa salina]|uniref:Cytochrome P450 n=2 Tax=Enhygromyxa salina TaxID=215803 RepID=A0A0C2D376_9BACT|nr:cytochrome P450 [Enhygromyxa salina]